MFKLIWSYQAFGGVSYLRSAKDIAYNVPLFIAKKGSYVNYYSTWYHHYLYSIICSSFLSYFFFWPCSKIPVDFSNYLNLNIFFLVTYLMELHWMNMVWFFLFFIWVKLQILNKYVIDYASQGLVRQPKWGHLTELHAAIKSCSQPLLMDMKNKNNEFILYSRTTSHCMSFLMANIMSPSLKLSAKLANKFIKPVTVNKFRHFKPQYSRTARLIPRPSLH